jgi:hypothetical protein
VGGGVWDKFGFGEEKGGGAGMGGCTAGGEMGEKEKKVT